MSSKMASSKWDSERTTKFIQLYKLHTCLWNFMSSDYKNKLKRDAAYFSIMQEINIADFGIQDVKNKIKNLRSTYSQEMKKMNESREAGTGLGNVYTSKLKWLKEMEDVFMNDPNRKTSENTIQPIFVDTGSEEISFTFSSPSPDDEELLNTNRDISTNNTGNTSQANKRSRDILISEFKTIPEEVNYLEETSYDMFGRSVAGQLKTLSVENALLAQSRIQSILTEFGIKDHREKTASMTDTPQKSKREKYV